jgi:NAD(P)-dependent dehydrogenase (short-subunit alcohol dehydrogenase family)
MNARVAFITGAGQGIGLGIARRFLEEGLRVVIAEVDAEAGEEAARGLAALGDVLFVATDVADGGSVREAVRRATERSSPASTSSPTAA